MKRARAAVLGVFVTLASASVFIADASCSLVVDHNASQCTTTADCTARGSAFAKTICSPDNVCVLEGGCSTNDECQAANNGQPYICLTDSRTCVLLTSQECRLLSEGTDVTNANTVWLGALYDGTSIGALQAIDVARRDFVHTGNGLPPANPGGPRRPLAFVACDYNASVANSVKHLVHELKLPATVGPANSGVAITVMADSVPGGVFLAGLGLSSVTLNSFPSQGLLARLTPTDANQVQLYNLFISSYIEPALRSGPTPLPQGQPLKVELLVNGSTNGVATATAVSATLQFNGKSVLDNGANYKSINYGDPADPNNTTPQAKYADAVAQTIAFQPNVIILIANTELSFMDSAIEAQWPAGVPRPYYVGNSAATAQMMKDIKGNLSWAARAYGLRPHIDLTTPEYIAFYQEYESVYPDNGVSQGNVGIMSGFDTTYFMAYAVAALGNKPLTGASIAKAFLGLSPPGKKYGVGTATMFSVLTDLAAGSQVDLDGIVGPADMVIQPPDQNIEAPTGFDVEVACAKTTTNDAGAGVVTGPKFGGLFYHNGAANGTVANCPGP